MSDASLRQNIIDQLNIYPNVNSAHIGVIVTDGIVSLSGYVASYAEKIAAEEAVKRIKGVRAIAQEIEVRFPEEKSISDDAIAARALKVLQWNTVVPEDAVLVRVQHGWVMLTGTVQWQFQREAAESSIRRLLGVRGVINSIKIKPLLATSEIKHNIEQALIRCAEIESTDICVSMVGDGKIALHGSARSWQEREAIKRAAWSAAGVIEIEDHLVIAS